MEVRVIDGDLEYAIRNFKKLMSIDGVLISIKFRELFPNVSDRRKEKARRALKKKVRNEKRRAERSSY